ncbi:MAG: hypothetical protein ACKO1Y_02840 [Actinomycetota bacterium]
MVRLRTLMAVIVGSAVPLVLAASPAAATVDGPCAATAGSWENAISYDVAKLERVTLPREDELVWQASVLSPAAGRRPVSGSVRADLPAPLPDVTIWSWQSRSTLKSNSGTYDYAFSPVLGGFDIPVTGVHRERGAVCTGTVVVRFEGGGFHNPVVFVAVLLAALSGFGLFAALRPRVG